MSALITLTTDFGNGSSYVAAMKGVILGINPAVRLVDISHEVGPQNVRHAAILLAEAAPWFPPGTIHLAVVDPGVGTERRLVYAKIEDQQYLAPDNGLLSFLTKQYRASRVVQLANTDYWMPEVSQTFHGRDILAPVAAQLSLRLEPERLGPTIDKLQTLDWPDPRRSENRIIGAVQWIDRFGNGITNIAGHMLPATGTASFRIQCGDRQITGLVTAYGNRNPCDLVALIGSSGFLEVAVVNGSAAQLLHLAAGTPVTVEW